MQRTPRSASARSKKKQDSPKSKQVSNVFLIGASSLLVLGLGAAFVQEQQSQAQVAEASSSYTPPAGTVAAQDDRFAAVFFGDSYTHGTGAEKDERWTTLVAEEMGWREINRGLGGTGFVSTADVQGCGQSFCPAYPGAIEDASGVDADVVVIAGGQNDYQEYAETPDQVKQAITKTYKTAKETFPDARIVAVGPSTAAEVDDVMLGMAADVKAAAGAIDAQYISLIDPDVIEDDMVLDDGGHVGPGGHAAIAKRVVKALPEEAATPEEQSFTTTKTAISGLDDKSKPWTLTVLGDSTGDAPNEWVHLVVERLAEETGRPAVIHDWSIESDSYETTTDISGDGEPIVVWNGSAHGKTTGYTMEHFDALAPEASDFVVISHGHNQRDAVDAANGVRKVAAAVSEAWDRPPALAVTLQNPRLEGGQERQSSVVGQLRDNWEGESNVTLIDAYSAFNDSDDVASLLEDDRYHPNDAGSKVWADAVWDDLGLGSAVN